MAWYLIGDPRMTEGLTRAILDATPRDRLLILINAGGTPLSTHRASEGLRQWRDTAGLTPAALGYDLRLQDTRGTAATRVRKAGLALAEIASHMRWSLRHAAAVIGHYASVSPDESDAILVKLALADRVRPVGVAGLEDRRDFRPGPA
jgi:hypothetical protein